MARISRKGNSIEAPKLSLIIACQPKTAAEMIGNKTFRDKGLPARFLFAVCRSLVGTRTFDKPEVSARAIVGYNALIRKLLDGVFDKNAVPAELTLTADGNAAYIAFSRGVEAKLGENGELRFMRDWCAKCPGMMIRIAGILAVCDGESQIDHAIIHRASEIAAWFMDNAAMVFGGGVPLEQQERQLLVQFLDERTIRSESGYVKTSDLLRHYNAWAQERGHETAQAQDFVPLLRTILTVTRRADGRAASNIVMKP